MMCKFCGAETTMVRRIAGPDGTIDHVDRTCANGHTFISHEVHTSMLADARELNSARQHIRQRVARFYRDQRIAADPRPSTEVAAEYGLTDARVRQIRSSARLNSERKEA